MLSSQILIFESNNHFQDCPKEARSNYRGRLCGHDDAIGLLLGKILKVPVILWTEGIEEPRFLLGLLTRQLRMFFVRKADAIIVPGSLSRAYAVSMGADASKVFVAPNSIDNQFFHQTLQTKQTG